MAMRTRRRWVSGMGSLCKCDLETGTYARRGIDGELGARNAGALLDDRGADPPLVEFPGREAPLELESAAVVLDDECAPMVVVREPDEHVARATVLPDVDQRLLHDARDFERCRRRERNPLARPDESRRDA